MAERRAVVYSAIHVIEIPLEDGVKLYFRQFDYEPVTLKVSEQVRYHAERAGLTMEDVENLAKDLP